MESVIAVPTALWWAVNDVFISRIPYAYSNPFVCAMWYDKQCPSFTEEGFSFWSYLITLAIMGPLMSFLQGFAISYISGEWQSTRSFKREICITSTVLFATSPFMAISYKLALEGTLGEVYHDTSSVSAGWMLMQVLFFNMLADTWFYWTHRLFHEVEFLYRNSHYLHHSAHPVNTFMGNGGDVFELITQGEMQVFFPPLFVPIQARLFVINALFMQCYTLFLHNGSRYRLPTFLRMFIIDPYEHNIHHYFGFRNHNFGLYFTFWDKVAGSHKVKLTAFTRTPTVIAAAAGAKAGPGEQRSVAELEHKKHKWDTDNREVSLMQHMRNAITHVVIRGILPVKFG